MGFVDAIRRVGKAVSRLFTKKSTMESAFDTRIAVSSKMEQALNLWTDMYEGHPPWVDGKDPFKKTLNLPAAISGELARLTTMELETHISGNVTADFLNGQYQRVIEHCRQYTEYACAKGGIALKPFIAEQKIEVSVIQPEDFFPTDFDSDGDITGAIFSDQFIAGNKKYTRLEMHRQVGADYYISNKAFLTFADEVSDLHDNILGKEVELAEIPDWENIEPEVHLTNVKQPLFAYFKMPLANQVEARSPLGVSVFSRAVDMIREADGQWGNILWELYATQAAVFADSDVFATDKYGNILLDSAEKRLYRKLNTDEGNLLEFYNPEIRDSSLFNALDKILKKIEFLCSLAYGTISDPQSVDKTATEVKQSNQRSFSLVCDIQKSFQKAHEGLLYAMYALSELYGLAPSCDFESMDITFEFDDSIVVDRDSEYQRRWAMVMAGKYKLEKFYAWYFGCSEEEAMELIPAQFEYPPIE